MSAKKVKYAICAHCKVRFGTSQWTNFCNGCGKTFWETGMCENPGCKYPELTMESGCREGEEEALEEWKLGHLTPKEPDYKQIETRIQQTRIHFETEQALKEAILSNLEASLELLGASGPLPPVDPMCDYLADGKGGWMQMTHAPAGDWNRWRVRPISLCAKCSEFLLASDARCEHGWVGD